MTISFLFILMILLAFFASQFSVQDTVPRAEYDRLKVEKEKLEAELEGVRKIVNAPDLSVARHVQDMKDELERLRRLLNQPNLPNAMETYNTAVAETRRNLLANLKDRINEQIPGVNVTVSANFDALQFRGDGLFNSGSATATAAGENRMRQIAGILDSTLSCYAVGPRRNFRVECNPAYALIDALQVEGHTDNSGTDILNMDLSAQRASSIYALMTQQKPDLIQFLNRNSQPVLSVAGFGKGRPMQDNHTKAGQDANRRIDLRFIMVVPSREADIEGIKKALSGSP
ncbi:OmpA family protein [Rhizobium leguminosarum]|uniref:OmpA family protein n=1 Tax=Rhizobium leguminosarum TaxID=384 RepID=UPI001FDF7EE0|nr:OmpA family protein [Rhizobium leguminosarum]